MVNELLLYGNNNNSFIRKNVRSLQEINSKSMSNKSSSNAHVHVEIWRHIRANTWMRLFLLDLKSFVPSPTDSRRTTSNVKLNLLSSRSFDDNIITAQLFLDDRVQVSYYFIADDRLTGNFQAIGNNG